MLILVVDDEPDHRSLARRVMERGGHTVMAARDAAEALEVMAEHDVELVVTDLFMPGMDGLELAEQVHAEHPDVVCIVWSTLGSGDEEDPPVREKDIMRLRIDEWIGDADTREVGA